MPPNLYSRRIFTRIAQSAAFPQPLGGSFGDKRLHHRQRPTRGGGASRVQSPSCRVWITAWAVSAHDVQGRHSDLERSAAQHPAGQWLQRERTHTRGPGRNRDSGAHHREDFFSDRWLGCGDLAKAVRDLSSRRRALGVSARVPQENNKDGGCTLTSSDGPVTVTVLPPASGPASVRRSR